jgi:tetratricopeptide (TPR) repeat protein
MANQAANKILLIGWPGADWNLCEPLLAQGHMPNLQRLIARGAHGHVRSVVPILGPPAWTSVATGKRPHKHGIHGLFEPDQELGGARPASSESRTTKALWNILTESGLAVHVIGWPASHPAEPTNGIMVTDRHAIARVEFGRPWPQPDGSVHPPELRPQLAPLRLHPEQLDYETLAFFVPSIDSLGMSGAARLAALKSSLAATVSTHAAATWTLENRPWDVAAICYSGIEQLCHAYGRYAPSEPASTNAAADNPLQFIIPAAYRFHDMMLGRLLQLAGDDATVILLSAHGHKLGAALPRELVEEPENAELLHTPSGVCVISGPLVKANASIERASILDVTPTILTLLGLPHGADMDGRPLLEIFHPRLNPAMIASWGMSIETHPRKGDAAFSPVEHDALQQLLAELQQSGYTDPQEQKLVEQQQRVVAKNRFLLARSLLEAGELANAHSILEELHADSPAAWPIAEMLLETLLISGDPSTASKVLDSLPGQVGDSAWRHLTRGRIALNQRCPNDALLHFLRARELVPRHVRTSLFLGQTYLALRRWTEAREAFNAALAADPHHAEALYGLANIANKQTNFAEAIALTTQSLAVHELPLAYYQRGYALMKLRRNAEAADDFSRMLQLLPTFRPAKRFLNRLSPN